jgi:hypothetical protein
MTLLKKLSVLLAGLMAMAALDDAYAQAASANDSKRLVVVELFQSQGCSSCPPAEANLNAIAAQPNVLALSYAVTYWDDLGWKDTFAQQIFTDRQWSYARRRGRDNVWTPQVYINGRKDIVGTSRSQLDEVIADSSAATTASPTITWQPNRLSIGAGTGGDYDIWLVRYDPRTIDVPIGAGENSGRVLPHRNIVRELVNLGHWNGKAQEFALPLPKLAGLSTAALIQSGPGGAIIGAAIQR